MKIQIRYILLPLLVAIIVYFSYLFYYVGAFKSVEISEGKVGPFNMLFKNHSGAYHKIVPLIQEVETWAKANGLACKLSFGEYLDDPNETEEGRLRSRGGCLVNEGEKFPEQLPEGFLVQSLPERDYVIAKFEGSPGIGPLKVYPKVIEYFVEKGYVYNSGAIEIYEVHSDTAMTTNYYFPIPKK
jgi:AraC family transcriptional regulator